MKILVDKVELQKLLDGITCMQSDCIVKTRDSLNRILKNQEPWVVIEPRPFVRVDNTKSGFDKFSVTGTFNIINFFANEDDAKREADKHKHYAPCMVVKAMDTHKIVDRDKLAYLRDIIAKLELEKHDKCDIADKLGEAHQLIYEMQNPRE
jgi:hypothetical protein